MSEWISVEDRLPEEGLEVLALVLCEDGLHMYDLTEVDEAEKKTWLISGSQVKVTLWQPLPEPPE